MIHEQDLIERLGALAAALDLPDDRTSGMVDAVLARLDEPMSEPATAMPGGRHRSWALVAAVAVVIAVLVTAIPDARRAVARWFGLAGVSLDVEPGLSPTSPAGAFTSPGPGESKVVTVDGVPILVSAIASTVDEVLLSKTVGSSGQVQQVEVAGWSALWIGGRAHEVVYRTLEGDVLVERVAANTLLWHEADVLLRLEGFPDLESALDYASTIAVPARP